MYNPCDNLVCTHDRPVCLRRTKIIYPEKKTAPVNIGCSKLTAGCQHIGTVHATVKGTRASLFSMYRQLVSLNAG